MSCNNKFRSIKNKYVNKKRYKLTHNVKQDAPTSRGKPANRKNWRASETRQSPWKLHSKYTWDTKLSKLEKKQNVYQSRNSFQPNLLLPQMNKYLKLTNLRRKQYSLRKNKNAKTGKPKTHKKFNPSKRKHSNHVSGLDTSAVIHTESGVNTRASVTTNATSAATRIISNSLDLTTVSLPPTSPSTQLRLIISEAVEKIHDDVNRIHTSTSTETQDEQREVSEIVRVSTSQSTQRLPEQSPTSIVSKRKPTARSNVSVSTQHPGYYDATDVIHEHTTSAPTIRTNTMATSPNTLITNLIKATLNTRTTETTYPSLHDNVNVVDTTVLSTMGEPERRITTTQLLHVNDTHNTLNTTSTAHTALWPNSTSQYNTTLSYTEHVQTTRHISSNITDEIDNVTIFSASPKSDVNSTITIATKEPFKTRNRENSENEIINYLLATASDVVFNERDTRSKTEKMKTDNDVIKYLLKTKDYPGASDHDIKTGTMKGETKTASSVSQLTTPWWWPLTFTPYTRGTLKPISTTPPIATISKRHTPWWWQMTLPVTTGKPIHKLLTSAPPVSMVNTQAKRSNVSNVTRWNDEALPWWWKMLKVKYLTTTPLYQQILARSSTEIIYPNKSGKVHQQSNKHKSYEERVTLENNKIYSDNIQNTHTRQLQTFKRLITTTQNFGPQNRILTLSFENENKHNFIKKKNTWSKSTVTPYAELKGDHVTVVPKVVGERMTRLKEVRWGFDVTPWWWKQSQMSTAQPNQDVKNHAGYNGDGISKAKMAETLKDLKYQNPVARLEHDDDISPDGKLTTASSNPWWWKITKYKYLVPPPTSLPRLPLNRRVESSKSSATSNIDNLADMETGGNRATPWWWKMTSKRTLPVTFTTATSTHHHIMRHGSTTKYNGFQHPASTSIAFDRKKPDEHGDNHNPRAHLVRQNKHMKLNVEGVSPTRNSVKHIDHSDIDDVLPFTNRKQATRHNDSPSFTTLLRNQQDWRSRAGSTSEFYENIIFNHRGRHSSTRSPFKPDKVWEMTPKWNTLSKLNRVKDYEKVSKITTSTSGSSYRRLSRVTPWWSNMKKSKQYTSDPPPPLHEQQLTITTKPEEIHHSFTITQSRRHFITPWWSNQLPSDTKKTTPSRLNLLQPTEGSSGRYIGRETTVNDNKINRKKIRYPKRRNDGSTDDVTPWWWNRNNKHTTQSAPLSLRNIGRHGDKKYRAKWKKDHEKTHNIQSFTHSAVDHSDIIIAGGKLIPSQNRNHQSILSTEMISKVETTTNDFLWKYPRKPTHGQRFRKPKPQLNVNRVKSLLKKYPSWLYPHLRVKPNKGDVSGNRAVDIPHKKNLFMPPSRGDTSLPRRYYHGNRGPVFVQSNPRLNQDEGTPSKSMKSVANVEMEDKKNVWGE